MTNSPDHGDFIVAIAGAALAKIAEGAQHG